MPPLRWIWRDDLARPTSLNPTAMSALTFADLSHLVRTKGFAGVLHTYDVDFGDVAYALGGEAPSGSRQVIHVGPTSTAVREGAPTFQADQILDLPAFLKDCRSRRVATTIVIEQGARMAPDQVRRAARRKSLFASILVHPDHPDRNAMVGSREEWALILSPDECVHVAKFSSYQFWLDRVLGATKELRRELVAGMTPEDARRFAPDAAMATTLERMPLPAYLPAEIRADWEGWRAVAIQDFRRAYEVLFT